MPTEGARLAAVVAAFAAMTRSGDTTELTELLDEQVVWRGLRPELVCTSRDEVIGLWSRQAGQLQVTQIEARELGDAVAISVEGPGLPENEVMAAGTPRSLLFKFKGARVVEIQSFQTPGEVLEALQAAPA